MDSFDKHAVFNTTCRILENHIPHGFYAEDFSDIHTKILSSELMKHFDFKYLVECKDEVRNAIKSHFSDTHDELIVVFYNNTKIIIREKANLDKKQFNRLVLKSIKKFLTYDKVPFLEQKNGAIMKLVEERLRSFRTVLSLRNEKLFRKVLKEATKKFLHLDEDDQVLFLNSAMFVKKASLIAQERRSSGLPHEELKKIHDKYFNRSLLPQIQEKLLTLISTSLDFSAISNEKFSKIFIKSFQSVITEIVKPTLEHEDDGVIKHFANYLLRQYFDDMMLICAQQLVDKALNQDVNAKKFLLYYNGGFTTLNGKPHIKPLIMQEDGNEYEIIYLFTTISRYKLVLNKVHSQEKNMNKIQEQLATLDRQKADLEVKQRLHVKELMEFERIAKSTLLSISKRNEHRFKVNKKILSPEELSIIERKESLQKLSEQLNEAVHQFKKDRTKEKKILALEDAKIQIYKKELANVEGKYFEIMKAISRAMAQKPEPKNQN